MSATTPIRVLLVDGDPEFADVAATRLERADGRLSVETATSADEGFDRLAASAFDCVVSGHDVPGTDGIAFLEAVRAEHGDVPFVVFADAEPGPAVGDALDAGVTGYLYRDGDPGQYALLANRLADAVDAHRARRQSGESDWDGETMGVLRRLYDVTTNTALSFEEKIDLLLELGCEELGLPYGFLTRIEVDEDAPGAGVQSIVAARGDHEGLQPGEACPLSEAYCRKTIETDGLLAIQDALDAGWEDDPAYRAFELGSYIGGTVLVDGDLYGTFCFASSDDRAAPFTEVERTLVRVISKWAGYELERERRTVELQRTNDRLEEVVGVVSHDLRNPLNVAQGRLELAREECNSDHLDDVGGALDRSLTLIEDLLTLAREGKRVDGLESVDLGETVVAAWRSVETAGATLDAVTDRTVRADGSRLQQLLENLFRNAVEHGDDTITVTVGDVDDGFYVEDDGPGIPEEEREQVFEAGHTTVTDGTGFGLSIVERIADAHGWTVDVTEGADGGARFEITGVEVV